jgi:hypothetical protein
MATTDRMQITYPDENQDPWYSSFQSSMNDIDAAIFADFETRNQVLLGGGTLSWNGTQLSWNADIVVVSPAFGNHQVLSTSVSPLTIQDNHFLILTLTRGVTSPVSLNTSYAVSATIPINSNSYALCYRAGTSLYFSTGMIIKQNGYSSGFHITPGERVIAKEAPSGAKNGSNTIFDLANTPIGGSEQVFLNGLLQSVGASEDYVISGTQITLTNPPQSTDKLFVTYSVTS